MAAFALFVAEVVFILWHAFAPAVAFGEQGERRKHGDDHEETAHPGQGTPMTHITLGVRVEALVAVRCPWCGRVWGHLPPGTPYRAVRCPQRDCRMEISGTA